jgi:hypothetical protein
LSAGIPAEACKRSDRVSPHPIFARIVLAEDLAGLLGKMLIKHRRRLVAALLRLGPSPSLALFLWSTHRNKLKS